MPTTRLYRGLRRNTATYIRAPLGESYAWFGRELVNFFKVQPYTPTFRNRKAKKLLLCLADFYLSWAKTGYPLPLASLFTLFSESKKSPTRIKGKRFSPLRRRSESEITFVFGLFLLILGGNGLSTSMCNPILTLFYGEKSSCEDKLSKSPLRR